MDFEDDTPNSLLDLSGGQQFEVIDELVLYNDGFNREAKLGVIPNFLSETRKRATALLIL